MNTTPKVSIIMPVRNAGAYLHDCLSSVRGQTFSFWELIVVNDHSTDNGLEILQEAAATDDRIQLYQNEGQGIIPALQMALGHTSGQWITRMDGDDLMPPDKLEMMVNAMEKAPAKTIVTGKVKYFSSQPVSEGYLKYEAWLNERIAQKDHWNWVYRECVIASPNWMMNRAELLGMGGFSQLQYPEDYHLVLKWYELGFQVQSMEETTLHWREHPERTSRNSAHYNQEHFFQLKIRHFVETRLGHDQLVLWGTGPKGRLTAELLDSLKVEFQWMDLDASSDKTLKGHSIKDFRAIEKLTTFRLLIAVFPPSGARKKLEAYLDQQSLNMGRNYWYL